MADPSADRSIVDLVLRNGKKQPGDSIFGHDESDQFTCDIVRDIIPRTAFHQTEHMKETSCYNHGK